MRSCRSLVWRCWLLSAAVLVGAAPLPVDAQITTATVSGTVQDSSGGVTPGATVTLVSVSRGTTLEFVSTADGSFVFPTVPADTYTVRVTLEGFKTLERSAVVVAPGDRLALGALKIDVGNLSETVTVAGAAPLVQ